MRDEKYPPSVSDGMVVPYRSFVPTRALSSKIPGAGTGLFSEDLIAKYTWIGFYPGKVTSKTNRKLASHTMGTSRDLYIIADPGVKTGVHMVNEATVGFGEANVYYVKLSHSGYVLYFAGRDVEKGEELFTCYSRNYMKRPYSVPKTCADPRCANNPKHRTHSGLNDAPEAWREELRARMPPGVSQEIFDDSKSDTRAVEIQDDVEE